MTTKGGPIEAHSLEQQLAEIHESAAHWALVCCDWNRDEAEIVDGHEQGIDTMLVYQGPNDFLLERSEIGFAATLPFTSGEGNRRMIDFSMDFEKPRGKGQ